MRRPRPGPAAVLLRPRRVAPACPGLRRATACSPLGDRGAGRRRRARVVARRPTGLLDRRSRRRSRGWRGAARRALPGESLCASSEAGSVADDVDDEHVTAFEQPRKLVEAAMLDVPARSVRDEQANVIASKTPLLGGGRVASSRPGRSNSIVGSRRAAARSRSREGVQGGGSSCRSVSRSAAR